MKKVIFIFGILMITNILIGQSVSIKDSNEYTLINIIDEGNYGSMMITPWVTGDAPQAPIDNKLYNRNGELYWSVNKLALGGSSGWKDDGTIVRLLSSTDSVGIGTTSPTEKLDVNGNINLSGIVKIDGNPFLSNLGVYNLFGGENAGINNTGNRNTFFGYEAGNTLTSSSLNTFVGYQAGLNSNAGDGGNTYFGSSAGKNNVNGHDNVFIGCDTGLGTDGDNSTIIGARAGGGGTGTGNSNTFVGHSSGFSYTNADYNVFCGAYAGYNNTGGNENTYIGHSTGYSNTTGIRNTFMGYQAGVNSTGSYNVFIGSEAGKNETGSNKLYIENSDSATPLIGGDFTADEVYLNGWVGVGTSSPDEKFEVEFGSSNVDVEFGQGTSDTDITFFTLRSPDGTKYYLYVDDEGSLTIIDYKP